MRTNLRKSAAGFTYFGVLLTIALLGATLAAMASTWSVQKQRALEEELIHVGQAYRRAIASYYNATPNGAHQYPQSLAALVLDERGAKAARHLRELYPDPMTGRSDWQLVSLADGAIIGVTSSSTGRPLKRSNFGPWEAAFEGTNCFCDWKFVYLPQLVDNANISQ